MNRPFRFYFRKEGGHYHGQLYGTGAQNGELTFDEVEWGLFRYGVGVAIQFIDKDVEDKHDIPT